MFKPTMSFGGSVNLLDFVDDVDDGDEEISSFEEFQDWANSYNFKEYQSQSIVMKNETSRPSRIPNPHKNSLSIEIDKNEDFDSFYDRPSQILSLKKSSSKKERYKYSMEESGRGQRTLRMDSLNIPLNSDSGLKNSQIEENSVQNTSVKKSSAHSSRSAYGYKQINQYEIREQIGSGAFSKVHLAKNVMTDQQYAVKILTKKKFRRRLMRKSSEIIVNELMTNEVALLKKMTHPHVTKLYEVIEDKENEQTYLILQYCSNGYLNEQKLKKSNLSFSRTLPYRKLLESECKRYMKQIALAFDYIHNIVKIAHRDIKPENILLSKNDQVKLSDFGLGTDDFDSKLKSGTKNYMAPEITNNKGQKINNQMLDIWAIGITLIVMLSGKTYEAKEDELQSKKYLDILKEASSECKDFISKCLQIDPEKRITSAEMLTHPWLQIEKNINEAQEKPEVTEDDLKNAIGLVGEIIKYHL